MGLMDLDRRERFEIMRRLFFIGYSVQDIVTATGRSRAAVYKEFLALGGKESFGKTPRPRSMIYSLALLNYAHEINSTHINSEEEWAVLRALLETFLDIPSLLATATATAHMIHALAYPNDRELFPYRQLLIAVVGEWDEDNVERLSGERLVKEYLHHVGVLQRENVPARHDLDMDMQKWALRCYRNCHRLPLFETGRILVDRVLETLSSKKRDVIRMRFGLIDRKPLTLEECAERLGMGPSAVRETERKALLDLRKHHNVSRLRWITEKPIAAMGQLLTQLLQEYKQESGGVPTGVASGIKLSELLRTGLVQFGLSARTESNLAHASITTLGDLISHTENQILHTKHIGKIGLQEIKDLILVPCGISFRCEQCEGIHTGEPNSQPGCPWPSRLRAMA